MAISVAGSESLPRFGLRPLRWRLAWLGVWLCGWMLAVALSLLDPAGLPPPPGSDKLGHLLAYALLAAWAALIFRRGRPLAWALLGLLALGCGLELAQGWLTSTRAMEWLDAVANTLGVLLGGSLTLTRVPDWLAARFG
ncbi:MAG TPA: VanZ family protein [Arenimonas sp.]|nr:VanZ family protein [Arenimonas sp.]